tara:strand:+ start:266 stop:562 length:297 start_codon:yes stop_codon:yes gene_type:complete
MNIEKIKFSTEITVFQLRAARAALRLTFKKLSELSGISEGALIKLEIGDPIYPPKNSSVLTIGKVRTIFERLGIEFYQKNIIRLTQPEESFMIRVVPK